MVSHHRIDSIQITDSVHGEISIPKVYFEYFIDTPYFQRLRRIEQTMARALYPSSRHDRFTHSLGVYHIGHLIVESLMEDHTVFGEDEGGAKKRVFATYELACLLHDVGHSPFSHSFEKFFDCVSRKDGMKLTKLTFLLIERLEALQGVRNEELRSDCRKFLGRAAPHERMSAFLSVQLFDKEIKKCGADAELLARMIIGCRYQAGELAEDKQKSGKQKKAEPEASDDVTPTSDQLHKSFCNAMIELIHGDVVDADGIDYVLRDTWSAGYATTSVDYQRLIRHIKLRRDNGGQGLWQLCFSHLAIPEIKSVLANKTFEHTSVYPHNTLILDRHLLIEGMKAAAHYHYRKKGVVSEIALRKLCDVDAYIKPHTLPRHGINFYLPQDDDFVTLMKWCIKEDPHIRQWFSHKYDVEPLWLSLAEFYDLFGETLRNELEAAEQSVNVKEKSRGAERAAKNKARVWDAQKAAVKSFCEVWIARIQNEFFSSEEKVLLLEATHVHKDSKLGEANLYINQQIKKYSDIFPEDRVLIASKPRPFFYIFVPKGKKREILQSIKDQLSAKR